MIDRAKFLSRLAVAEVGESWAIDQSKVLLAGSDDLNEWLCERDDLAVRWALVEDSP